MTFGEHLEELRWRLIRAVLAVAAGVAIAFVFRDSITTFFVQPYQRAALWQGIPPYLVALHPTEVFMVVLKLCVLVGVLISSPYAFYQVWAFVAAGLYPRERRLVTRMVPASVGLFALGVAFLFYIVLPVALRALMAMNSWVPTPGVHSSAPSVEQAARAAASRPILPQVPILAQDPVDPPAGTMWISPDGMRLKIAMADGQVVVADLHVSDSAMVQSQFDLGQYVSFVTGLAFGFGFGFQVPLVVLLLSRIGIVSAAQMGEARKVVILIVFIAAAIITPTADVYNLLLLAVPMVLLFEIGLLAARLTENRYAPLRQASDEGDGLSGY